MLQRTVFGALAAAAVVGGVLLVKALKVNKETEEEEEEGIHFITIDDVEDEEEESSEAVKEICGVYPYLTPVFVEGILASNAKFLEEYEDDTLVTVYHKSSFEKEEAAEQFMEILDEAGYSCEKKDGCVTAHKNLFTQDGAIISDILNVANQTCALEGTYQDYEVEC